MELERQPVSQDSGFNSHAVKVSWGLATEGCVNLEKCPLKNYLPDTMFFWAKPGRPELQQSSSPESSRRDRSCNGEKS